MVHRDRNESHQIQGNYPSHPMTTKPTTTTPYPALYICPHSSTLSNPNSGCPSNLSGLQFPQLSRVALGSPSKSISQRPSVFSVSLPGAFPKRTQPTPPTLCSGRTGLRRDRKASAWQGLQACPRPTAAPLPGRLGVPRSSRLASELSLYCVHQQVPPPSPYGALARPRLGSSPTSPPLAEPAGRGEPPRASSPAGGEGPGLVRTPAQPVTAHARTRGRTGALAPALTSGHASRTGVRPRSRCSLHTAATPAPQPPPPAPTPGSRAGSAQVEGARPRQEQERCVGGARGGGAAVRVGVWGGRGVRKRRSQEMGVARRGQGP